LVFPKNKKSRRPEGAGAGLVAEPQVGQTTVYMSVRKWNGRDERQGREMREGV